MHAIRLHGPWTYITDTERDTFRVPGALPQMHEQPASFVKLVRVFHEPTGLEANPRIYLSGEGCFPDSTLVCVNDECVGKIQNNQFRCEVKAVLRPSNELTIEVTCNPGERSEIRVDRVSLQIDESRS